MKTDCRYTLPYCWTQAFLLWKKYHMRHALGILKVCTSILRDDSTTNDKLNVDYVVYRVNTAE